MQKKLRFEGMLTASLSVFVLALVGWGGSEFQSSSDTKSSVDSPAETTASSAAVTEPATDEEASPQAAHLTQQVNDQIIGADPKDAYARVLQVARSVGKPASCGPTQPGILGPYFVPDAPVRSSVGTGYVMSGQVLSASDCEPIPGAQLEFWLADSQGVYDEAHMATVPAGERGEYQFQSTTSPGSPKTVLQSFTFERLRQATRRWSHSTTRRLARRRRASTSSWSLRKEYGP